jgi:hypothetical protein
VVAGIAAILLASVASASDVAATARLIRERRAHTATAIGNGKILVAGGRNLSGALSDVEIFDAATGAFTAAARLLTPRAEHTATRLADGRVLLIGGRGGEPLTSTEFFDPSRDVFSSGPSLNSPRFGHTATLLADGRIVVIGGNAEGTAEIFDPRASTFAALPCRLSEPRSFHAAVRLLDGSILIAGGIKREGATLKSAEILHPDTLECEPIASMFVARSRFTLRLLPDGKVQAIGGDAERTMELFNPAGYFSSLVHLARAPEFESAAMRSAGRLALIGPSAGAVADSEVPIAGGRQIVRPVQSLLDRIDYSMTEIPESGAAIVAGGVSSAGRYQQTAVLFESSAATVTTDKTDYAPGETVVITGTGWLPGETVTLNIHRDTNDPPDTVLSAVADASGNITNSEYVVQQYDLGVTFLLTATGQTSGFTAQTSFTDGNVRIRSNATGVTFTLTWSVFPGTTCSGTASSTGTETNVGFSGGARFTKGVGNTESISLEAAATATAPAGQPFIDWSADNGTDPFTVIAPRTICVSGQFAGTREYVASYGCTGRSSGFVCRPATDACDAAETCDGVSALCPADGLKPSGTVCRPGSGDLCDPDETCTGSSAACPADVVASAGTICNPGSGDACDPDERCTGTPDQACPADTFQPATFVCNQGSGDACDPDERCTGTPDQACPADTFQPATFVCNQGSGDACDPDERCTGTPDQACPADTFQPATFVCNQGSGDACDPDEFCTGTADQACPSDTVAQAGTTCRPAAGVCDAAEQCTGAAEAACPADAKKGSETTCRGAAPECDVAEVCSGASDDCPPDVFQPPATACSSDSNACTIDQCSGTSATCGHILIPNCGTSDCTTNTPPIITSTSGNPPGPISIGGSVQVTAEFTDASTLQTHTCTINWGDGSTPDNGTVTEPIGTTPGTCTGSHTYSAPDVYTVTITIADGCTSTTATYTYVVIFDPNGGFVTGGGWISSPLGACTYSAECNPAVTGKATFGFVSKYKNTKTTTPAPPEGNTNFHFNAGNFKFDSDSYEWLVISGAKARYRGTGQINGAGSYGFELTAWDGQAPGGPGQDMFRIKIWQGNPGNAVYDNERTSPDGEATTALGGGSIVIHKAK